MVWLSYLVQEMVYKPNNAEVRVMKAVLDWRIMVGCVERAAVTNWLATISFSLSPGTHPTLPWRPGPRQGTTDQTNFKVTSECSRLVIDLIYVEGKYWKLLILFLLELEQRFLITNNWQIIVVRISFTFSSGPGFANTRFEIQNFKILLFQRR